MRRCCPSARPLGLRCADGPAGRHPRLRRRLRGHPVVGDGQAPARGPAPARGRGRSGAPSWTSGAARAVTPCSSRTGATTWWGSTWPPGPWSSPGRAPPRRAWSVRLVIGDALDLGLHAAAARARPSTPCSTSGLFHVLQPDDRPATPTALAAVVRPGGARRSSSRGATGTRSGSGPRGSRGATSAGRSGRATGWRVDGDRGDRAGDAAAAGPCPRVARAAGQALTRGPMPSGSVGPS